MNKIELLDYIKKHNLERLSSVNNSMSEKEIRDKLNNCFAYAGEIEINEMATEMADDYLANDVGISNKINIEKKRVNDDSESLKEFSLKQKNKGVSLKKINSEHYKNLLFEMIDSAIKPFELNYEIILLADGCKVILNSDLKMFNLFTYNRVTFRGENMDVIKGNLYFNPLKGIEEVKKIGGNFVNNIELSCDSSRPSQVWLNSVELKKLPVILSENDFLFKMVEKLDSRANIRKKNREQMEQQMRDDEPNKYNMKKPK